MVLIIGNSVNKVPSVINELEKHNEQVIYYKADKCLDGEVIRFEFLQDKFKIFAVIDGNLFDLDKVNSIWYWKPMLPKELRTIKPVENQIFIYRQFLAMWRSVASILQNKNWLNDYYKLLEAEHKPYQLKIASEIGFNIPRTIITSEPVIAIEFWEKLQNKMIIKSLMMSLTEDRAIFTNIVTSELMKKIQRLKSSPVILQELLLKKHELRITIVGKKIFSAEIINNSPVDWRRKQIKVIEYNLPESIKSKCLQLVKRLGLRYGCIDMIVTPKNEYFFLEINPNGQYWFIEENTGMMIGKAIAHLLTEGR